MGRARGWKLKCTEHLLWATTRRGKESNTKGSADDLVSGEKGGSERG